MVMGYIGHFIIALSKPWICLKREYIQSQYDIGECSNDGTKTKHKIQDMMRQHKSHLVRVLIHNK